MKKNQTPRRIVALANLKDSKFYEKNYRKSGQPRNLETWQDRKDAEIETLEKRIQNERA